MGLAMAVVIASGMATRYNPGVMETVVANRELWGQLPADTDPGRCVALLECERIGDSVWVEKPDGAVYGPFVVADCAARQDRARLVHLGFAVDLSYEAALEIGVVDGPLRGVRVWNGDPRLQKLGSIR